MKLSASQMALRGFPAACGLLLLYCAYVVVAHAPLPQMVIRWLPELQKPNAGETIVVFAAHQDDETLGAGAYIAAARQAGAIVYVAFASDGATYAPQAVREREALSAMQILGVDAEHVLFFGLPDTAVSQHRAELKSKVQETLAKLRPAVVFVTDPSDGHPDHHVLGSVVLEARRESRERFRLYTYLIHFHGYSIKMKPQGYLVPPAALFLRKWVRFSAPGEDLEKKKHALLQYQTQLSGRPRGILLSFLDKKNELFTLVEQ